MDACIAGHPGSPSRGTGEFGCFGHQKFYFEGKKHFFFPFSFKNGMFLQIGIHFPNHFLKATKHLPKSMEFEKK